MKRKKLVLAANAALGPTLGILALIAYPTPQLMWLVAREDGGMHVALAIILAIAIVYSCVFQLWLVKLSSEPHMRRIFDDPGRRWPVLRRAACHQVQT